MSSRPTLLSRKRGPLAPAVLVGLLAFALTLQWRAQGVSSRSVAGNRAALAAIVAKRQARTADLERRLAELRAQFATISATNGTGVVEDLRRLSDALAGVAGTTPVSGPGVTVTLRDAAPGERGANATDSRIQDVDVQAIVNELWTGGAEAIAVNGERIVATTAIRNAGQAVLVNYHVLSSPYVIAAIGPSEMRSRFESSQIARRFRGWKEIYGLGFDVAAKDELTLPTFGGGLRLRYATAAGSS